MIRCLPAIGAALLLLLPSHAFPMVAQRSTRFAIPPFKSSLGSQEEDPQTKQLKLDTPAARQKYVSFAKPRLLQLLDKLDNETTINRANMLM